jgi:hypothetical protein
MSRCFPLVDILGYESSISGKTYRLMCGDIGNTLCRNPNLGLTTKAKACKVVGQEKSPIITFHVPESAKECEGMNPHTPK